MNEFVHLHVHTEYSLEDSIIRIPELTQQIRTLGMSAVALTDVNNLFALVKFYQAAIKCGVKPIIGLEAQIAGLSSKDTDARVVFLCKNDEGYRMLSKLITKSYLEGQGNGTPTMQRDWLVGLEQNLIVLSGAQDGDVGKAIISRNNRLAEDYLRFWHENFPNNYYIELQRTGNQGEDLYTHHALQLATKFSVPVAASNNVRFLRREDFDAHEARVCIQTGRFLHDPRRPQMYSEWQYLRSSEEMSELFEDIPEAISNSGEIAKRCNVILRFDNSFLPEFPNSSGLTPQEYIHSQAEKGLRQRLTKVAIRDQSVIETYTNRLDTELEVIDSMGYAGYFLIVADFTRWAKEQAIPVGPGRGSGAGSLIAYALGITDIDPLRYDLLFERFLNPDRVSLPDFDIDFCMDNRDRVFEYVAQKYGRARVSQIITYGSMAARAVVRDVGRVLGHPYGLVNSIAKLIPFEVGMTLEKAMECEPKLQERCENEEDVRAILDMSKSLEGLVRNAGKHAGGVVIAPTKLTDFTPLYCEANEANVVTQLDKDDVEAIGLVKFDFLGLRTLTIIDNTLRVANEKRKQRQEPLITIDEIPLDDIATYETLQQQQTTAVFQLESSGIRDIIKRLKPDKFDDVVALVALYRPGPLQSGMVEDFILRKHGAPVDYFHPDLQPILKQTYGVILYQEQVMQIAQVLAGYTLGSADLLRRAMGKKKREEMAQQREVFVSGAVKRGVKRKLANRIFDLMEEFGGYGFNKSHSVAYALLAYQTAWLKTHFPAEFMSSVMSSDIDNTDKVVDLIDECRGMKIKVVSPDINSSDYNFIVSDDNIILYGLGAIKGVGKAAVEQITQERKRNGSYQDMDDFCMRLDTQKVNRRCIESLIRAGAMDDFGYTRASLFQHIDKSIHCAEQQQRDRDIGQNDMFGHVETEDVETSKVQAIPEWGEEEKLSGERATLGLYLTGHPINRYQSELEKITGRSIRQFINDRHNVQRPYQAGGETKTILVGGLLDRIRQHKGPKGRRMAFLTLDDNSGRIEVAVFADDYEKCAHVLVKDAILIIDGNIGWDEFTDRTRLRANKIWSFDEYLKEYGEMLSISVQTEGDTSSLVQDLEHLLLPFKNGNCRVLVKYRNNSVAVRLGFSEDWKISLEKELLCRLNEISEVTATSVTYGKQIANA